MQHVNLLPSEIRERERQQVCLTAWCVVSMVVAAGLLAAFMMLRSRESAAAKRVDQLTLRRQELDTRILRLRDLSDERDKLQARERIIRTLKKRRSLCFLFADLANRSSELVWMESTTVSPPKEDEAQPTSDTDTTAEPNPAASALAGLPRREVTLNGFAPTTAELARFMSALQQSRFIQGPELRVSKRERFFDKEATKFEIQFEF